MRELIIPFGNEKIEVKIAQENIRDIIQPVQVKSRDSKSVLTKAIENPLHERSLDDFFKSKDSILCIVNDATRPTRTALFLDLIKEKLKPGLIKFLVATGAHRPPNETELRSIFGDCFKRFEHDIMIHDARDTKAMAYFGKTRYGNELWLNKLLKEYERILVIGSVEPHYFAGFTGGRKSLLPGVASYHTIEQNHKHAVHPKARPLNLDGNPLHEEMTDCVRTLDAKDLFSLQMVLDKDQNVHEAYAGPLEGTFEKATHSGAAIFQQKIAKKAEVVVTVAQRPFDVSLYQTLKAIEHGRMALAKNGILIVVSPCHEGLGPRNFARLFDDSKSIEYAAQNARKAYQLGDHNALNLISLREFCSIWTITHIPSHILQRIGVKQLDSIQGAIDQSLREKGKTTQILFILDGSLTVPQV